MDDVASRPKKALFISYDGLTDPLGRSQVLPYLVGLAGKGHRITILSAEKPEREKAEAEAVARLCREAGIDWVPIRYHARPPILSSVRDLRQLLRAAARLHRERGFDIVHCRSYLPAIVGLAMKREFGTAFLFDMRGFWADEKVEGGSWRLSNPLFRAVYRFFKRREAVWLAEADHVVSLTEAAKDEIEARRAPGTSQPPISVIPCCVDFGHFQAGLGARAEARRRLGIEPERPVLAYLGSLGGNYLLDEMLDFFRAFRERRPGALFLFVTRDDPEMIRRGAAVRGIGADELLIRAAGRDEVPAFIAAADLGVAFKQASFSALACSPTKLGEMLALGIPMVVNKGVGDVDAVIADTRGGVEVDAFDPESLGAAADAALRLPTGPAAIRDGAARWFSLADGVERYDKIYRTIERPPANV